MESQIYFALVGEEQPVKRFATRVNVVGASVRELGAKSSVASTPRPWKWRTARRATDIQYPEDSVAPMLRELQYLLAERSAFGSQLRACVTIVCKVAENERPQGFSISTETIQLLNRFDAGLEIDFVSSMSPAEQ